MLLSNLIDNLLVTKQCFDRCFGKTLYRAARTSYNQLIRSEWFLFEITF